MKNFFLGSFVTLVILTFGVFLYLRFGRAEVRADLPPSKLEEYVMNGAVHASVRRHAPEMVSPVAPTEENLIVGGKLYPGWLFGLPRISAESQRGQRRQLVSTDPPIGKGSYRIYRGTDLLGYQAWHKAIRHVCEW